VPDTLIVNARLVNEGRTVEGDLRIHAGRIEQLGSGLAPKAGERVIDAEGHLLMPGMIDDQVHFREPGLTHKADLRSESRAAVAGGVTSFMDMPNTRPQTVTLEALEDKCRLAADHSLANYAFYFGATNDNLEAIRALDPGRACGIKVFMGASTGNMLVDDRATLEAIFRDAPVLVATHCEDTPTIARNEAAFRERYGEDVPMRFHPQIRSAEACYRSSSLALELARAYGTRLHVLHLTTAREVEQFEPGPSADRRITAEACVHHLYFDEGDYEEKGPLIKCNPAIKTRSDRDALRAALLDGRIDLIGTDHAPHTLEEKAGTYFKAPAGLPLVQHALPMALELYHEGLAPLQLLVDKLTHAPARLFDIAERGYLREGYWADLALVDLGADYEVRRQDLLYKCGWSPLEGRRLHSRVLATFVNGAQVYARGTIDESVRGQRLRFARNP
jgi:dihydroorotase